MGKTRLLHRRPADLGRAGKGQRQGHRDQSSAIRPASWCAACMQPGGCNATAWDEAWVWVVE